VKPQTKTADAASSDPLQFQEEKKRVDSYFAAHSSGWNDIYQREDVYSVIYQDRRSIALRYFRDLSLPQDARILEIGCGAGMTSVDMARCGYTVEAVDSVKAMIDLTRQNALKFGVEKQIHAGVMDVYDLQYPDQGFDLVVALGVVPWLADSARALKEISRVLAPGGHVLISADNYWRLIHLLDPAKFPPLRGHRLRERTRLFLGIAGLGEASSVPRSKGHTVGEFDALLEAAGLVKLIHQVIGFGPFTLWKFSLFPGAFGIRLHRLLQYGADRGIPILRSTGSQYLVLGEKK
jgi:2-polyprenyl-3-methyl-5-hydroxy-6-metoxy-1,4-benzoquinol methylase